MGQKNLGYKWCSLETGTYTASRVNVVVVIIIIMKVSNG